MIGKDVMGKPKWRSCNVGPGVLEQSHTICSGEHMPFKMQLLACYWHQVTMWLEVPILNWILPYLQAQIMKAHCSPLAHSMTKKGTPKDKLVKCVNAQLGLIDHSAYYGGTSYHSLTQGQSAHWQNFWQYIWLSVCDKRNCLRLNHRTQRKWQIV